MIDILEEMVIREEKIRGGVSGSADRNNVVFTVDRKFTFPLGVAITSVLLNNRDVNIHVFIDDFESDEKEKIIKTAKIFSVPITIYYVDARSFENFPIRGDWSVAVYFRFLAADVLKSRYSRILYMDADVICKGSLQDIFQLDIEDKALAAVPDPTYLYNKDCVAYSNFIGHRGDGYFNAGVMLLDLQKWQSLHITENALSMLQNEPDRYIQAQDQDVLNVLFANKVYWLPEKYNTRNNIEDAYPDDTVMIHYSGSPKPWKEFYYSLALCSPFMKVKEQSLWANDILQPPTKTIEYRFMSRKYVRTGRIWKAFFWQIKYIISKIKEQLNTADC